MPEEKNKFIWNPLTRDDIHDVYLLFETVNRIDNADYDETEDDLMRQFDDPWSHPTNDVRVIRTIQGKLAAFLRIYVDPKPIEERFAFIRCLIAPEARSQGLEEASIEWMEARAKQRLAEIVHAEHIPSFIRAEMPKSAEETIQRYQKYGFAHARSYFKMERNLKELIPESPLPDGLTLRTYGKDIDEKLLQALNEAFRDHWGHVEYSIEDWPFIIDASNIRHDLTSIVMEGYEVVAFCINYVNTSENKRLGIQRATIESIGTQRAWRARGIASALLSESMRLCQTAGLDYLSAKVDSDNLTGAVALYERLGFKTYKTLVIMEKKIDFSPC